MKNTVFFILLILAVAIGFYLFSQYRQPSSTEQPALSSEDSHSIPTPDELHVPKVRYPVADIPTTGQSEEPLPGLDESDRFIETNLAELLPAELFIFKNIIRHFVVNVDNATEPKLPKKYSFARHPKAKFIARKTAVENQFIVDPENFERYAGFVDFLVHIQIDQIAPIYVRIYPLLQEAYEELGYPGHYFNDRFIEVLDHLLATPEVPGEIRLIKPKYLYQYADPELESLSASQKMLIRIGHSNATKVKAKLRQLRSFLINPNP